MIAVDYYVWQFYNGIDCYVRQLTNHQFICHNQPYIIIHNKKTMYSVKKIEW